MTLIEMMIVVVILAVLAGIATMSYSRYIKRTRTTEASTMLQSIAGREEAYRQEFGVYCGAGRTDSMPPASLGPSSAYPASSPTVTPVDFTVTGMPREWTQLGFRPAGRVRYRYVAVAGAPPNAPPGESTWSSNPNQDAWYVTEAYGNLDNDSALSTFRLFSGNGNTLAVTSELE
ncbi:MAG: prepilin-type N-terminal cleavage/methylation domain-containing protein [Myxococcales bacterium]|nr:prepilin-type N-terminal cleavage/methylation domain-containing protein [Myxococcales bacterium]